MRLPVLFAAAALLSTTLAAHADTIRENLSVTNVVANQDNSFFYGANTNFFSQFNPSLGTLNSITLSLNGTATENSNVDFDLFVGVLPASAAQRVLDFNTKGAATIPSPSPRAGRTPVLSTSLTSRGRGRRLYGSTLVFQLP